MTHETHGDEWNVGGANEVLLAQASGLQPPDPREMMQQGGTLQRMASQYATAIKVQQPRDLNQKTKQLTAEARIAGEAFFYGWGSGKDRVLGPSIGLAMAAARVWGNCVVEPAPLQETPDSWVMTMTFVDLETGFTVGRQFRQAKDWQVFGKLDEARKEDIRFQIGQSKAARNVILQAIPKWLIDMAMKEAMAGVRDRVEKFVEKRGIAAAQDMVVEGLSKHGVSEQAILAKMRVSERKGLSVDHIVALRGDLYCLDEGQDRAPELFPAMKAAATAGKASDVNQQLDAEAPPEQKPEQKPKPKPKAASSAKPKQSSKPKPEATKQPEHPPEPPAQGEQPGSEPEPEPQWQTPEVDPETGEPLPPDLPEEPGSEPEPVPPEPEPQHEPTQEQEPATPEPEPQAEQQADEQGIAYPDGFLAAIASAKAVGQVQDLLKAQQGQHAPDVWAAMQGQADARIQEIRASYRRF